MKSIQNRLFNCGSEKTLINVKTTIGSENKPPKEKNQLETRSGFFFRYIGFEVKTCLDALRTLFILNTNSSVKGTGLYGRRGNAREIEYLQ